MNIDHDDVATQLVYLVTGTEDKVKIHHVTDRLTGIASDHPLRAEGGHIGMVGDLIPYAKQVSAYLQRVPTEQEFPGVFEYEVTETLGAWLADNWEEVTPASFEAELEARATAYFAQ